MKLWRDCRTENERAEVVAQALRSHKSVKEAARALKMSRRHLTRLLPPGEARRIRETTETGETMETRETRETSSLTSHASPDTGETRTQAESLTYGKSLPTFRHVSSATANPEVESLMLSGVPKPLKDWLQEKALRRVQQQGGRFALSPVAIEILEAQRLREEQGE